MDQAPALRLLTQLLTRPATPPSSLPMFQALFRPRIGQAVSPGTLWGNLSFWFYLISPHPHGGDDCVHHGLACLHCGDGNRQSKGYGHLAILSILIHLSVCWSACLSHLFLYQSAKKKGGGGSGGGGTRHRVLPFTFQTEINQKLFTGLQGEN